MQTEAYKRQTGASHDRTLSDHFLTVPHYYGFDKAGGIEAQKQEDYGEFLAQKLTKDKKMC